MIKDAKATSAPNGSLVWRMGQMWGILPPNINGEYLGANIRYSTHTPNGITDTYFGKGSFKRSFQIIGTPTKDTTANIKVGWVRVNVTILDGKSTIEIDSGREVANKRWSMGIPHYSRHNKPHPHYNRNFRIPGHNISLPDHINVDDFTTMKRVKQVRDMAYWEWLRSEVYIRDKGICWLCNEFVILKDYDLGHLVDRSNGGNDALDNCAVMHKRCNMAKPRHYSLEDATAWRLNLKITK